MYRPFTFDSYCELIAAAFSLPAVAAGISLGVYLVGGLAGGHGTFLSTLAGMSLGVAAGLLSIADNRMYQNKTERKLGRLAGWERQDATPAKDEAKLRLAA